MEHSLPVKKKKLKRSGIIKTVRWIDVGWQANYWLFWWFIHLLHSVCVCESLWTCSVLHQKFHVMQFILNGSQVKLQRMKLLQHVLFYFAVIHNVSLVNVFFSSIYFSLACVYETNHRCFDKISIRGFFLAMRRRSKWNPLLWYRACVLLDT